MPVADAHLGHQRGKTGQRQPLVSAALGFLVTRGRTGPGGRHRVALGKCQRRPTSELTTPLSLGTRQAVERIGRIVGVARLPIGRRLSRPVDFKSRRQGPAPTRSQIAGRLSACCFVNPETTHGLDRTCPCACPQSTIHALRFDILKALTLETGTAAMGANPASGQRGPVPLCARAYRAHRADTGVSAFAFACNARCSFPTFPGAS